MLITPRTQCVLCYENLEHIYTDQNQPITYCPKNTSYELDIFTDLSYGACIHCGSVQLMTLIDPSILYEDSHNITYNTPTWKQHHIEFANFVLKHADSNILEIGGLSGILANNILNNETNNLHNISYSILDICPPTVRQDNITYIIGNCEEFQYAIDSTVIMSHLFEHLYNPREFIENLSRNNVSKAIISIPNMSVLLKNKSPAVIHTEHTYYLDSTDAVLLFKLYGYELKEQIDYKTHSHFMYFMRNEENIPIGTMLWSQNSERRYQICKTLQKEQFKNMTVKENSFIVPAGHYGQIMYTFMKNTRTNVIGFLDNDPSKQNKRVYGTDKYVYPMNALKDYANQHVHIYLHAGPYTSEITTQILALCPTAEVIEI